MNRELGIVLAALQLAFALTWVIYVIYLPNLAIQAGLPKAAVPWILMLDQAIFVVCDWAAGMLADRVAAVTGRIGVRIAAVTAVSATAFLLMPWIAPAGSPALFIALTIVWSATSSALRAPPMVLIGRYAATPQAPWLAGLYLLGLGIASATAPYFGATLRDVDPRLPFVISTVMVVVVTGALASAERKLPAPAAATMGARDSAPRPGTIFLFAAAVALFALGFQLHFSVNSAPAYLRFATQPDLERLMPVFWIGFNVAILPATLLTKRFGGLALVTVGGVVGTLAAMAAPHAPTLDALIASQLVVGAAWSVILMSAFTAALEAGRPGREGSATGMLFSMLAVAAFARIAFVAAGMPKAPVLAGYLPSTPALAWAGATLLAAALLAAVNRGGARSRTRSA